MAAATAIACQGPAEGHPETGPVLESDHGEEAGFAGVGRRSARPVSYSAEVEFSPLPSFALPRRQWMAWMGGLALDDAIRARARQEPEGGRLLEVGVGTVAGRRVTLQLGDEGAGNVAVVRAEWWTDVVLPGEPTIGEMELLDGWLVGGWDRSSAERFAGSFFVVGFVEGRLEGIRGSFVAPLDESALAPD